MTEIRDEPVRCALIIGGSLAGMQAALDLADSGIEVYLVDSSPFVTQHTPTSSSQRKQNTLCLEASRHPNIHLWTSTSLQSCGGEAGHFRAELRQAPRYVDLARCTACGDCIAVCPISIPTQDSADSRKAIYLEDQPGCAAIDKRGLAPCRAHCPINQRAQGYIALIRQGRFADAYRTIKQENPFPSVCGRVCNHRCEDACSRGGYDEPVNIMGLKRFVADWAFAHREEITPETASHATHPSLLTDKRIAIIGAGPAGLTAALDLVRMGYSVTVFDALPLAGGMMRVGIPPHRLPDEYLDWEIQQIVNEGVELRLSTWVDDIPALLDQGYHAVLIATGAHHAKKLPIRNSNHPNNWFSLDVLRKARLSNALGAATKNTPALNLSGKKVVVLGGGNVALDTARTVLRLGADEVRMACLEPRGEMPGFKWEVSVAESEGIQMYPGRTFKEIMVLDNEIVGVCCVEIEFHGFKHGRPDFSEISGSEHILPADIVVWAIGQAPNFSFLPEDGSINTRYPVGVQADEHMMTTMQGVFVAGDVRRGVTFFVVDAIAEGHFAARSIDSYLRDEPFQEPAQKPPLVTLSPQEIEAKIRAGAASAKQRVPIQSIPLQGRISSFQEVDLTLTETEVMAEAERCLRCGICSECLACVEACKPEAIIHTQCETIIPLVAGAIIEAGNVANDHCLPPAGRGIYHASAQDALQGSAAAARVMADLGGKVTKQANNPPLPPHRSTPTHIGVFVCQCGGQISQVVDTEALRDQAATWPEVVHAQVLSFSCSPEAAAIIEEVIETHALDRVVLAACSCCAIDQICDSCTYQRVRCKDNLGVFPSKTLDGLSGPLGIQFDFVNIREQCAWPHASNPPAATAKAISMLAGAVAKARLTASAYPQTQPAQEIIDPYTALIAGNGAAGHAAQEALTAAGITIQHLSAVPNAIYRAGMQFVVVEGGRAGNDNAMWHASAIILAPSDEQEAQRLLEALSQDGHRPALRMEKMSIDTQRPGVYVCDFSGEPEIFGYAAAARVLAWLGRTANRSPLCAAFVDPVHCRACSTCIEICEFGAPMLVGEAPHRTAWIDPLICTGCGICAVHCPSSAITPPYGTSVQLETLLEALLEQS